MVIFLIVTFGLPLLCVILSNHIGNPIINLILLAIQGATPSIGSLIVFRKTINAFIKDKVLHNISIKWWLVSMLFPVLMLVLSKGIIVVVGKSNHVLQAISPNKLMIIAWALIAEEFGWRGYLQEELKRYTPKWLIPIIVGFVWTLWHYHFVLAGTMNIPYVAFCISCILESYGYLWISDKCKGNVIPACLWHMVGNFMFNILAIESYWICNLVYLIYPIIYFGDKKLVEKQ